MKAKLPPRLELWRIRTRDQYGTKTGDMHGAFEGPGPFGTTLKILSSGPASDWEHVSVSTTTRTPSWQEMCWVKDLFWGKEEVVMQLHPAKSEYVNHHPYCLHLWKPIDSVIPLPPSHMVGPKK
jgi:hypothetical protein